MKYFLAGLVVIFALACSKSSDKTTTPANSAQVEALKISFNSLLKTNDSLIVAVGQLTTGNIILAKTKDSIQTVLTKNSSTIKTIISQLSSPNVDLTSIANQNLTMLKQYSDLLDVFMNLLANITIGDTNIDNLRKETDQNLFKIDFLNHKLILLA